MGFWEGVGNFVSGTMNVVGKISVELAKLYKKRLRDINEKRERGRSLTEEDRKFLNAYNNLSSENKEFIQSQYID